MAISTEKLNEKCVNCGKPFGAHHAHTDGCPTGGEPWYSRTQFFSSVPNLKDIVKDNETEFSFLRAGYAFYTVAVNGLRWMYPVELADLQNASIYAKMKAITMMRYIRKALEDGSFVREGK